MSHENTSILDGINALDLTPVDASESLKKLAVLGLPWETK